MNSIQDLTLQLYNEGVEKGKQEASRILAQASQEKEDILAAARKEADQLVENAQKQALALNKNTKAELQLFARQSVDALKSEIVNLLTDKVLEKTLQVVADDKAFMQKILLTFVQSWASDNELDIQTEDAEALRAYFKANAIDILEGGLTITQVNHLKTNFVLAAKDGSYKIQFGKEEFAEYFKTFLRPELVKMLF